MTIKWTELKTGRLEGAVSTATFEIETYDDLLVLTGLVHAIRDGRVVKVVGHDGEEFALNQEVQS